MKIAKMALERGIGLYCALSDVQGCERSKNANDQDFQVACGDYATSDNRLLINALPCSSNGSVMHRYFVGA